MGSENKLLGKVDPRMQRLMRNPVGTSVYPGPAELRDAEVEPFDPLVRATRKGGITQGNVESAAEILNWVGSIGGVGARHAPKQMLAMAERMAERNSPQERILKTTGWMQDPSGRWMFEIPDHNVNLKRNALDSRYNFRIPNGNAAVGDILDAPDLYKKYPQLRDLPVQPQVTGTARGSWQYDLPAINLREGLSPDSARKILLHELAHATQSIEGLTNGSAPAAYITPADKAFIRAQEKHAKTLAKDFSSLGLNSQDVAEIRAFMTGQSNSSRGMNTTAAMRQLDPKLYQEFERLIADEAYIATQKIAAYDRYRNISGEQVAEAVSRRADLSPQEYKNRLFFRDFDPPHSASQNPLTTMEPGPVLTYGVSP